MMRAIGNKLAVLCLGLLLIGCTVRIVEDYDPILDQGLTAYQSDIAAFLARMSANADRPEGKFGHPDVKEFYARTKARLQSFVDRAEALDTEGRCLPANFVGRGIKKAVADSAGLLRSSSLPFHEVEDVASVIKSFGGGSDEVSTGNCTVVMVKVVQANQEVLRLIHKENNALPEIVVSIAGPTIDQSARIAIKNEVLKKNRGSFN